MRYYWGLGVGHTYAHVQGSTADKVEASTSHVYVDRFNDLENELTISELNQLQWQLSDTEEAENGASSNCNIGNIPLSNASSPSKADHSFEDLGAACSFVDLEALEWEVMADGGDVSEDDDQSDNDLGSDAPAMYEMYDSDWANGDESD